jgi:predicted branched-subunit amino acid permease
VLLGGAVSDPATFGLDAAFPAGLLALLWPSLRDPVARRVALLGAAVALLAAPWLPAGAPVLLALVGLVAALPVPARLRAGTQR